MFSGLKYFIRSNFQKMIFKKKYISVMKNVLIDNNSSIGAYTYIGQNTSITKTVIGRYCSIGSDVIIGPGNHPLNKISTSAFFFENDAYDVLTEKECIINNDVWIGAKTIVLRGVTVGNGSVIAAGAVVTKNVPPFAVVAGIPAKIVKYRFDSNICDMIEKTKWWEYGLEEAKSIQKNLREIIEFEKN